MNRPRAPGIGAVKNQLQKAEGETVLRSSYMMLPGRILDEQEQFYFYSSCLAAAQGCPVTVRTFDFGADRTMADAYQGVGIYDSFEYATVACTMLKDKYSQVFLAKTV